MADFYPGTGWTDPKFLSPVQTLDQSPHLLVILPGIVLLITAVAAAVIRAGHIRR